MDFLKKKLVWVGAAVVAVVLVVGYFVAGPGSGDGYSAPEGGYSDSYNYAGDGHNHDHDVYGVR